MNTDNSKFTAEELNKIDAADDLKISPLRNDGITYGTPTWIWEVTVDGNLYVRAYNGIASSWHKSAVKQKAGRIHAAGMIKEVNFEPVRESELITKIDNAYQRKYSKSPYMQHMIGSRAQSATVLITLRAI